jgi:hypothetical protein
MSTDPLTGEPISGGASGGSGYDKLQKSWDKYQEDPDKFWDEIVTTGFSPSDEEPINTMGDIGEIYQSYFSKYNKGNYNLEGLEGTITDLDIEDRAFNKNLPEGESKSFNAKMAATIGIARGVNQDVKTADEYIGIDKGNIDLKKASDRINEMTKSFDLKTEEGRAARHDVELKYAKLLIQRGVPFNSGQANNKTVNAKSLKEMGFLYADQIFNQLYNEKNLSSDEVVGGV